MKKKVLAVLWQSLSLWGLCLHPAETGSVYAGTDYRRADGGDYCRKRKQNFRKKCRVRKLKPKLGRSS